MNANSAMNPNDYIDSLRRSKSKSSVILLEFLTLRSMIGNTIIQVFEGGDDKIVYSQWLKRCRFDLNYEPFVCNNKEQVLRLHDAVVRNQAGAKEHSYFFIDRDFDDYKSYVSSDLLFMTDQYAVENYLVCRQVVDDLLKNEFPCHGAIELRGRVLDVFERLYDEILDHLNELNFHIYVARCLKIELRGHIPDTFARIAVISADRIDHVSYDPSAIVPYMTEVTQEQRESFRAVFTELDRRSRHRGKFAFKFLSKWLAAIVADYKSAESIFFSEVDKAKNVRESDIVLSNLASKSPLPTHLCDFINKMN